MKRHPELSTRVSQSLIVSREIVTSKGNCYWQGYHRNEENEKHKEMAEKKEWSVLREDKKLKKLNGGITKDYCNGNDIKE